MDSHFISDYRNFASVELRSVPEMREFEILLTSTVNANMSSYILIFSLKEIFLNLINRNK